jgi:hypothetical protein
MSSDPAKPHDGEGDLLWGAKAIADHLRISLERARYLIRTQRIPVARLGPKTIIASRRRLDRALAIE